MKKRKRFLVVASARKKSTKKDPPKSKRNQISSNMDPRDPRIIWSASIQLDECGPRMKRKHILDREPRMKHEMTKDPSRQSESRKTS